MNFLPSKLEKLRKHYNYSQAYLAQVLGVEVVEYMGYENGRNIITYNQAKKLATLYRVSILDMIKNSDDVTLHNNSKTDTDTLNIEYFIPKKTILMRAKEHPLLAGIIAGVVVAIIAGSIILTKYNKSRPVISYLDNTDRLAVSDTSLIYIDDVGAVKGAGDNPNGQISNLPSENALKVCEGSDFSLILLNDGTVVSQGLKDEYQKEISTWENIIDIAAGLNHAVAIDSKGKVYYVGDNAKGQCDLNEFEDIKQIFAAPLATIAVTYKGTIIHAGSFIGTSVLNKYTNIKKVDVCDENLILLKGDGTCDYAASHDDSIYLSVTRWEDIVDVACGNDFFAGLKSDGSVVVASNNETYRKVSSWTKIIAIDSGNNYLIGFNGSGIQGAGKNEYHQFASDEVEKKTLDKVSKIIVDYNNDEVKVSFVPVENANEYEVTLYIDEENYFAKKAKANEEVKFDTSELMDNNVYVVKVVALGDSKIYENSKESLTDFVFLKEVKEKEEEKIKIRTDIVGSNRNDFEEYLHSIGVEEIGSSVDENNICEGDYEAVVEVSGITLGSAYSKSELSARNITYTYCKLDLKEEDNGQNLDD